MKHPSRRELVYLDIYNISLLASKKAAKKSVTIRKVIFRGRYNFFPFYDASLNFVFFGFSPSIDAPFGEQASECASATGRESLRFLSVTVAAARALRRFTTGLSGGQGGPRVTMKPRHLSQGRFLLLITFAFLQQS